MASPSRVGIQTPANIWREVYSILYTKYFNQAALKKITQQKAWELAIKELGLPLSVQAIKDIHYRLMGVNKKVLRVAERLKKKYDILILSKNTRGQFKDISKRFPSLRKVFGKNIINTWEYDLPKASKEAMQMVLDRFNVKPVETVFIDDQEQILQAGKEMGVHTVLYKNFEQFKKDLFTHL